MTREDAAEALTAGASAFGAVADWSTEPLEHLGRELCEQLGLTARQLFMTLRVAITGGTKSPPLFESMEILGKDACIRRVEKARALLTPP